MLKMTAKKNIENVKSMQVVFTLRKNILKKAIVSFITGRDLIGTSTGFAAFKQVS